MTLDTFRKRTVFFRDIAPRYRADYLCQPNAETYWVMDRRDLEEFLALTRYARSRAHGW